MDIVSALEHEGAKVSGPVATVSDALRLIEENELDGALVDANLRGRRVDDIAAALTRNNVPFVFVTGYGRETLPSGFVHARILKKPFTEQQLLEAATLLVEQPREVLRLRD
jgi:two-component SAPR family response regulator